MRKDGNSRLWLSARGNHNLARRTRDLNLLLVGAQTPQTDHAAPDLRLVCHIGDLPSCPQRIARFNRSQKSTTVLKIGDRGT